MNKYSIVCNFRYHKNAKSQAPKRLRNLQSDGRVPGSLNWPFRRGNGAFAVARAARRLFGKTGSDRARL